MARSAWCDVYREFFRSFHPSIEKLFQLLPFDFKRIIQLDINVANGVAIDVAYDVRPVWWMEVYPYCFNASKSLF